jgi:hypothetical protein
MGLTDSDRQWLAGLSPDTVTAADRGRLEHLRHQVSDYAEQQLVERVRGRNDDGPRAA